MTTTMEPHFATVWESIADAVPDQPALVQAAVRRTWRELDDRASRLAGALLEVGLRPGSTVGLYLTNGPEYLEAFFACLKVRAVPCNVNYRYVDQELSYLLDDSGAEALVYHAGLGDRVERALRGRPELRLLAEVDDGHGPGGDGPEAGDREGGAPKEDGAGPRVPGARTYEDLVTGAAPAPRAYRPADDHYLVYTGGTTGMPKGVIRPLRPTVERIIRAFPPRFGLGDHESAETLVDAARQAAHAGRQVAAMPAAPLMHHTGLGLGATPALTAGGRVVLLAGHRFDPHDLWDTVERERVEVMAIVGDAFARPMLAALAETRSDGGRDLGCLRLILSAGVMFSTEVKAGLLDRLPRAEVLDFIASTEATVGVSVATAGSVPPTGRFTPYPGVVVLDDDDGGVPVPPGSRGTGMLAVPGRFGGYRGDEAKTAAVTREVDGVAYTLPGDVASCDADGTITLLGRGSACINTGGEKVFPEEVEETAKCHPAVDDCLVLGLPDERFGQRIVAVVALRPGHPPDVIEGLAERLRGELAGYKAPREVAVVDRVPRGPSGKADYAAARDLFLEAKMRA